MIYQDIPTTEVWSAQEGQGSAKLHYITMGKKIKSKQVNLPFAPFAFSQSATV